MNWKEKLMQTRLDRSDIPRQTEWLTTDIISDIRYELGLTQLDMSDLVGGTIYRETFTRYEAGKFSPNPSVRALLILRLKLALVERLRVEEVKEIPVDIRPNKLYICGRISRYICPCGNGHIVELKYPRYVVKQSSGWPTVQEEINLKCSSYKIKNGLIIWR